MTVTLHAALPARLELDTAAGDGPVIVAGLAVPWDTTVRLNWWGDTVEFAPGAFDVTHPGRVKFAGDHRTGGYREPLVFGYGVEFRDVPEGLWARFAVPRDELDDPDVARIVRQMRNGVRDALSIGCDIDEADEQPHPTARYAKHYRVTRATLLETSSVVLPRFDDARHAPIAAAADTDPDGRPRFRLHPLAATADPSAGDDPADDTTDAGDHPDTDDLEDDGMPTDTDLDAERTAAHVTATRARFAGADPTPHPLARFRNLGEYARARYDDPTLPDLAAAWVDQTTGDNPGVMQPAWLNEVRGIVDLGRPFITALGGAASPGDTGMSVHWPYFDGDLYDLVAEQAAEKTEVTSVKVSIKDTSTGLKTYAGGSDISLQLIERSEPSYLAQYLRIMSAAFAAVTDRAAVLAATAASTSHVVVNLATADDKAIAEAIFAASVRVQLATGTPARVVAVATDLFPRVAAAVMAASAPAANTAQASADASTLAVALAGLSVTHVPGMAAGSALVTNGEAFRWLEDGPRTIDALNVPKLGTDVAIYGFAAPAAFAAAGIVRLVAVAPGAAKAAK